MFEKSGNASSEGQNLNLNLENSFSSDNRGEFSNQIDEKFEERKVKSTTDFMQPLICTPAAKCFKNHFMTNNVLSNECNLLLPSHVGNSTTEHNNYSTCEYFTSPYGGITDSSNALQIIGCSISDQCMSNNFIGQMAYYENGTSQPILLASCYTNPQSGFNISGGNMLYQQGSCQYYVPYPVHGFGNNIQPVLQVVLPNSQPVPMLEYFNNMTYYTPMTCIAPESLEGKCNFSGLDCLQDKQNYQTYYEECSSKSGKEICSIVDDNNMPEVWHNTFDDLFGTFPHKWSLIPTPLEDPTINFKAIFSDNAKVRFMCRECRNAWTSMKGCIVFWINFNSQTGEVYFRLFGQQCQKCKTKEFQLSMWYPEEVKKVLKNLHVRVGHMLYGLPKVDFNVCRRQGKPRSPHNSSLCQACFNNVCTENKQ